MKNSLLIPACSVLILLFSCEGGKKTIDMTNDSIIRKDTLTAPKQVSDTLPKTDSAWVKCRIFFEGYPYSQDEYDEAYGNENGEESESPENNTTENTEEEEIQYNADGSRKGIYGEREDFYKTHQYIACYEGESFRKLQLIGSGKNLSIIIKTKESSRHYVKFRKENFDLDKTLSFTDKHFNVGGMAESDEIIIKQGDKILYKGEISSQGCH
jgi:hypothetical protein